MFPTFCEVVKKFTDCLLDSRLAQGGLFRNTIGRNQIFDERIMWRLDIERRQAETFALALPPLALSVRHGSAPALEGRAPVSWRRAPLAARPRPNPRIARTAV